MIARAAYFNDRGAATVWVLAAVGLVVLVTLGMVSSAEAVVTRHRTQRAADLVALAAAATIGNGSGVCDAAERSAGLNGVRLASCVPTLAPGGRSGSVRIAVSRTVRLPVVGLTTSTARARAGRMSR